jgi:site-specific DNA recombinase
MKKAAIYARVSSQKQQEEETIDSQVDVLHLYAKQQGYQIPDNWIFLDNGISGTSLQRPALDELRDMIRQEPVEAILIYAPDRLARSYPHQLILLEEFRKVGVKVCFLKGVPESTTPEAVMFSHLQGILAEYERALILDRSRRGRIYKAKKGDPKVIPTLPHGYDRVANGQDIAVEVIEQEANVIKEIFKLYVYDKKSLVAIGSILEERGIKTPRGRIKWDSSTIRGILKNTAYIGTAYFGKTERCEGNPGQIRHYNSGKFIRPRYARKKQPQENWLPINIPSIINENDFELAQEQLQKNKKLSPRNTKEKALLQGLVICGECGYPCYKRARRYKENNRGYYFCRSHNDKNLKRCSNNWIRQDELDELVYQEVINLLQNPYLIREELLRREKEVSNLEEIERQEANFTKEFSKLSLERDRLLDAYQSGLVDLKELTRRNQSIETKRNAIEKELKSIQALKFNRGNERNLEKVFDNIIERMKVSSNNLTIEEKQKLVRLLVEQVIVDVNKIKIVHCISPKVIAQEIGQLNGDDGN